MYRGLLAISYDALMIKTANKLSRIETSDAANRACYRRRIFRPHTPAALA
jgi:hypothetical protein